MIQIFSNICIPLIEQQVRLAATTAVDRVVAASRTLSETGFNATTPASSLGSMAAAGRMTCMDISGRGDGCGRPARPGRFTILDSEGMWQGRGAGWWVG